MPLAYARWSELMGLHLWHAHQLADTQIVPVTSRCNDLVVERAALNADRVGRAEIRAAIAEAERLWHAAAGFWPTPHERSCSLTPVEAGAYAVRIAAGSALRCRVPDARLIAPGVRIPASSWSATPVLLQDLDADGLAETGVAQIGLAVPSGATPDDVLYRFIAADTGPIVAATTRIAPRRVVISGGSAQGIFDVWNLVRPVLTAGWNAQPLDAANPATYAATIEQVYAPRSILGTTDETASAIITRHDGTSAYATVRIVNAATGLVDVGDPVYDPASGQWIGGQCTWQPMPVEIRLRYQAGVADGSLDLAIARLAAAIVARPVCACDAANREIYEWQQDLSRSGATTETFAPPEPTPWGTRRGHLYAWRHVIQQQQLVAL